jgi:hypothetical protein
MLDNMQSVAVAVKIGHGLGNTKWNGWCWVICFS